MPATDPCCPFPEHAPSVYTTSSADAEIIDGHAAARNLVLDGPGTVCDSDFDRPEVASLTVDEDEDGDTRPGLMLCLTG